jgi:hypothetical protein
MNVLKEPLQFIAQAGELIRPKTEQERRDRRISAVIVAVAAAVLLIYHYPT